MYYKGEILLILCSYCYDLSDMLCKKFMWKAFNVFCNTNFIQKMIKIGLLCFKMHYKVMCLVKYDTR